MYLAQGYNTATRVRIEPPTSRSYIRRSTTRPRRLPNLNLCCRPSRYYIVQNGCRPRLLYTAFNRRFGSRPRPNNQPSAAITTGAGETIPIVHLRYCVCAAKLVFSDEVNKALLFQQQADVFTWNHGGEDAYNYLNHSLKLSIPFSHFQIQKSSHTCTLLQIRELRENTLVYYVNRS